MTSKTRLFVFSMLLLMLAPLLMADTGPKPAMEFELDYEISPEPDIVSVTLLECQQQDCADGVPLEELGPQGIRCYDNNECDSLAYGYDGEYFQLVIEFSDGVTRSSNTFIKHNFTAFYDVTVTQGALEVDAAGGRGNPLSRIMTTMIAGFCCLGILVVVVVVLLVRKNRGKKAEDQIVEVQAEAPADEAETPQD